jgi:6-phospho-beta-glucosidase
VDSLAASQNIPAYDLTLFGRKEKNLSVVRNYADHHLAPLGWSVSSTTDLVEALADSVIVLHQIRYGGLAGRAADEQLSMTADLPPDETIGPGALLSVFRQLPDLDQLAGAIQTYCPDAWFLNLTNPLSAVVSRLFHNGVRNCIGLCELPRVTVRQAAAILGANADFAQWAYCGLNHRGFVAGLSWDGKDRTMDLAMCMQNETIGDVTADDIFTMGAVPTKYFSLYHHPQPHKTSGSRAHYLSELRLRILSELEADSAQSPPAMKERYLAWYPDAVTPVIEALSSSAPALLEVNRMTNKGLVEEGRAQVSERGIGSFLEGKLNQTATKWLQKIYDHERAVLKAMACPCKTAVQDALTLDPIMPEKHIEACSTRILEEINRRIGSC